jgi:hypothetical protein
MSLDVRLAKARGILELGTDAEAAVPAIRVHVSGDDLRMRSVATKLLATVGANSSEAEAEIVARVGSDDLRTCLEALLALERLALWRASEFPDSFRRCATRRSRPKSWRVEPWRAYSKETRLRSRRNSAPCSRTQTRGCSRAQPHARP